MDNILVTGGAGFIGSNFVRHMHDRYSGQEMVVLDALTYAGNPANLEGLARVDLVVGDICDTELVRRLLRDRNIRAIVHFAAESHVDRSIAGPDTFIETNIVGTHSLLKAAKAEWLDAGSGRPHQFHNISTDEVFGSLEADDPAFSETTPYAPNSPYSASKASADHLVRAYHHTFGLVTTTTNCSNNYGPYQYPEKLIPLFIINALHGRRLPIYGDGMNVRDWLHVADHCNAIDTCLQIGKPGETYNIGGGAELPNIKVIEQVCAAIDSAFQMDGTLASRHPDCPAAKGRASSELMEFVTDRKGHDRRYAIDEKKARAELAYAPERDFRQGLNETVAWYLQNETWWSELLAKKPD